MKRLKPVALEEEISVDIKIAAVVLADFDAEFFLDILLVQILTNPSKSRVAKIAIILTLATDIVDILVRSA